MKKNFTPFTIGFLAMLIFAFNTEAQSIEKTWVIDDMAFVLPEDATEEEIEQYEAMQGFIEMAMEEMRGSVTIEFKSDGTYKSIAVEDGTETEQTGSWVLDDNVLYMSNDNGTEEDPVNIELESDEMRFVMEEDGVKMHLIFIPK